MGRSRTTLTDREEGVFKQLWERGATLEQVRKVLPRLTGLSDRALRHRAVMRGLPFYRDGEQPDRSMIDEAMLSKLLSNKPRRV